MESKLKVLLSIFCITSFFALGCSHHGHKGGCGEGGCKMKEMSAEKHELKSQKHLKVAECLKAGKSKEECHKLMAH